MKKLLIVISFVLIGCTGQQNKSVEKTWLGKPVNFQRIIRGSSTYHMFDSTGLKVGSMVFGWAFKGGKLVSRDTSQFDDGSIYETAEFHFDTTDMRIEKVAIDLLIGTTTLDIDYEQTIDRTIGMFKMGQDTLERTIKIDSTFLQDVFREELYMLMHTIDYQLRDSLDLKVFVSSAMTNSDAQIVYAGQEQVQVPSGIFDCTVIWLRADGKMPDNKIWISNSEPKKIVKFFVPDAELSIELVDTRQHSF